MEENNKEIVEETLIEEETAETTPAAETAEAPEVETVETPAVAEKKQTTRRQKAAPKKAVVQVSPEDIPKKTSVLQLKTSLRYGFQLRGRYYNRTELGRKSVLEKLYKKYPGLFEK